MISEVVKEMTMALRAGHPRRYEKLHEDSAVVRGQIDFTLLSSRLPGSAVIPIRYSELGANNELSQVIKGIAAFLHRVTRSAISRQRLGIFLSNLSCVDNKPVNLDTLNSIVLSRYETRWSKTLTIGRLLLNGQSPDPTFAGRNQAFSMLFPMQHLYERALRKILSNAIAGSDVSISARSESLYLLMDDKDKSGIVQLRPDYILSHGSEIISIADAKWKRASENRIAHGVKREDFYQMYAYLARYKVSNAIILIPKAPWMQEMWTKTYRDVDSGAKVHIMGVDIEGLLSRTGKTRDASHKFFAETLSGILPL